MSSPSRSYTQDLNPPQLAAVQHCDGPILVLAGAGSGKTRVLTHRIAYLISEHEVSPKAILAVTFTNKATNQMRERLETLLGDSAQGLWVATFHSACLRILRSYADRIGYTRDFVVYDDQDSKSVLKKILKELNIDEKKHPLNWFRAGIEKAKQQLRYPKDSGKAAGWGYLDELLNDVYGRYQYELVNANAMDFSDLLAQAVMLLQSDAEVLARYQRRLRYVLVDEFQDTNAVQYSLVKLLSGKYRNLLVVGDDDQSIYAFRGATVENLFNFERDFPDAKVVTLEQNYRSSASILDAAYAVIEKNNDRKPKRLWTDRDAGEPIRTYVGFDEQDEADFIVREIRACRSWGHSLCDMAIFYRTNAQSRAIEEQLMRAKIPYLVYGGLKFYDRKEIKDIIAYLRLCVNERDNASFLRVINTPPRGIGAQTLKRIASSAIERSCSLWEAALDYGEHNKAVGDFISLIQRLRRDATGINISDLMDRVIKETGYTKRLQQSQDPTAQSRLENINELKVVGSRCNYFGGSFSEALQVFLDQVALTAGDDLPDEDKGSPPDERDQEQGGPPDKVSLMTLHLAKGLEFPVVFLTGLEEDLLPHQRSIDEEGGLEEERRLCYVGITRARQRLYLTRAAERGMFASRGWGGPRQPSRFLFDLPPALLESVGGGDIYATRTAWDNSDTDAEVVGKDGWEDEDWQPASSLRRHSRKPRDREGLLAMVSTADKLND